MATFKDTRNPFTVQTPEGMSASDVCELFVNVLTQFPGLEREGHVFLHGPRGSGKSMMFRYMQPDCQCIARKCSVRDLPFFSLYVPVKKNEITLPELERLERHANSMINEHFMVMHIAERLFANLIEVLVDAHDSSNHAVALGVNILPDLLHDCGWNGEIVIQDHQKTIDGVLHSIHELFTRLYAEAKQYLKRLAYSQELMSWKGPLCGYVDFLCPLLSEIRKLPVFPDSPIFLLFDDADTFNLTQTRVLNAWVASRTTSTASLKVSTQYRYKTYRTATGRTIDAPHDFAEVNISALYTASKTIKYRDRVREIIRKRLRLRQIDSTPDAFFPGDTEQEQRIKAFEEKIRENWEKQGRGYRPSDDSYRYARPDFMKSLAGTSKSLPSYSYAGFEQLVHISSGIIRDFLEPAARMFNECVSHHPSNEASSIPAGIQNSVVRAYSTDFMFSEFERMRNDEAEETPPREDIDRLQNLIEVLGGTFRQILLFSDRSERRVFSIAFSDRPDEQLRRVLRLGVEQGYFHESHIGNKDGTGRTPLYILSRKLAPHFTLDPSSFAGYLFVTSEAIREAMNSPDRILRKVRTDGPDSVFEQRQLKLFD
jgi:hypothetical protein